MADSLEVSNSDIARAFDTLTDAPPGEAQGPRPIFRRPSLVDSRQALLCRRYQCKQLQPEHEMTVTVLMSLVNIGSMEEEEAVQRRSAASQESQVGS